ncbi:hypothetical protein [Curvibacter sp. AEP1-3]|uniref:hypothetical protein n=1 Tax=Curvibacter sp. AEP1-3 TaxID=1844971 RepID=UPI000B3C4FA4|nr:hypothetical protein [Curvibacter sp. AEP1-3]
MDRSNYPNIPPDFPIEPTESALAGVQFKLSVVEEAGKYYAPEATPSEVAKAHEACEDFAQQMVPYCVRKMAELNLPHEEVLAKLLRGIHQKNWVSPAQAHWIVARTRQLLGW